MKNEDNCQVYQIVFFYQKYYRLTKTFIIKGASECRGGGRHIGHKLRVGGDVGRYTRYSQVLTPYTEDWGNNKTAEWYAGKKVIWLEE